jgi:hypothetical protein
MLNIYSKWEKNKPYLEFWEFRSLLSELRNVYIETLSDCKLSPWDILQAHNNSLHSFIMIHASEF